MNVQKTLETTRVITPLGIRFWDMVANKQVSDNLVVTARPDKMDLPIISAFRTPSGIYAFQGLPGLHDMEYPVGDSDPGEHKKKRFIIEVEDQLRRFLPVVFSLDLPIKGIFPDAVKSYLFNWENITENDRVRLIDFLNKNYGVNLVTQTEIKKIGETIKINNRILLSLNNDDTVNLKIDDDITDKFFVVKENGNRNIYVKSNFYLISAPTRSISPGIAAIRGQLIEKSTNKPAAHAKIEVMVDNKKWWGVANEKGCISILFPYPSLTSSSLHEQKWDLTIQVFYDPKALSFSNGSKIPEMNTIFEQPLRNIWFSTEKKESTIKFELIYGTELTLKTKNYEKSQLLIDIKS